MCGDLNCFTFTYRVLYQYILAYDLFDVRLHDAILISMLFYNQRDGTALSIKGAMWDLAVLYQTRSETSVSHL